jgi:nicotinamidase-related amidase
MNATFEDHCWKDLMDDEIREVYKSYNRETYVGAKPALLLIDLYNLVFEGGPKPVREIVKEYPKSCGRYAHDAIKPIQELIALARAHRLPLIYSSSETREEVNPAGVYATKHKFRGAKDAFKIRDDFKPEPGDLVIYKQRASVFFGTALIANLTRLGIDTLIVCGESTSGCVRASVIDAYSCGYHVVVVEECCFDRSLLSHKVNLFDMHHKYGDVMHLDEVKSHFQANSARKVAI